MFWLRVTLILGLAHLSSAVRFSDEKHLIKQLLENYEKAGTLGRPVYNTSTGESTVELEFGVALIQITELNERDETLKLNIWERYLWSDDLLSWEPSQHGGVTHISIPVARIWRPDFELWNGKTKVRYEARASVYNSGDVLWINNVDLKSSCSVDVVDFPHDVQECRLKYAAWTDNGFRLDPTFYEGTAEVDVSDHIESNEWRLLSYPAVKNIGYYPCCPGPFPDLTFTLRIARHAPFYQFVLIAPCVLLSLLTLLIFTLPNMADRVSLAIGIFAGFILLLLIVSEIIPRGVSKIPLIGSYLLGNTVLVVLAVFLSTIVMSVYKAGENASKALKKDSEKEEVVEMLDKKNPAKKQNGLPENKAPRKFNFKRVARMLDVLFFVLFLIVEIVLIVVYIPRKKV